MGASSFGVIRFDSIPSTIILTNSKNTSSILIPFKAEVSMKYTGVFNFLLKISANSLPSSGVTNSSSG